MSSPLVTAATAAAVGSGVWIVYKLSQVGKRESFLPPGPPTAPLLGNLHIFPTSQAHYQYVQYLSFRQTFVLT